MKKKAWIIALIVIAVIVAVMAYTHYTPFWLSLTNLLFVAAGIVLDRIAIYLYNHFIKS